jgi:hypothetical protein
VACNALHTVEARLACWLLLFQDRIDRTGALPITQELLGKVLGVRRTTITIAARALQPAGLIVSKWGSVTVLDRTGLERASCGRYGVIRERHEQGPPASAADRGLERLSCRARPAALPHQLPVAARLRAAL